MSRSPHPSRARGSVAGVRHLKLVKMVLCRVAATTTAAVSAAAIFISIRTILWQTQMSNFESVHKIAAEHIVALLSVGLAMRVTGSSVSCPGAKKLTGMAILLLIFGQQVAGHDHHFSKKPMWRQKPFSSNRDGSHHFSFGESPEGGASDPTHLGLRLRGGGGEGAVIYDRVLHHVKGAAVKATTRKLPDGSCICTFSYDGRDPLTLQVSVPA
jgi:hypothetical protein